jgi:hypothetical protein
MTEIFNGSLNSRMPWQKWAGHVVAETLMLGIWSIQYEPVSLAINNFKGGSNLISDAWKRA